MIKSKLFKQRWLWAVLLLVGVSGFVNGCNCNKSESCDTENPCLEGYICKNSVCEKPLKCETVAATCQQDEFCDSSQGDARCVKSGCIANNECGGQVCIDGKCVPPPTDAITSCAFPNMSRIYSPAAAVSVQVSALNAQSGVIPFKTFTLSTSDTSIFTVNGSVVTATNKAGTADIIANFTGGVTCKQTWRNVGPLAAGEARLVLQTFDNQGAYVPLTGAANKITTTDANGDVAPFDQAVSEDNGVYKLKIKSTAVAINVITDQYLPATIYGIDTAQGDYSIQLQPSDVVAGYGGEPDFTAYNQQYPALKRNVVSAVFVGASFPFSTLLTDNVAVLTGGELIKTKIDGTLIGNSLGKEDTCVLRTYEKQDADGLAMPRSLYVSVGTEDQPTNMRQHITPNCKGYAARTKPGPRLAWGGGLKMVINDAVNRSNPLQALNFFTIFTNGQTLDVVKTLQIGIPALDYIAMTVSPLDGDVLNGQTNAQWKTFAEQSVSDQVAGEFKKKNLKIDHQLQFNASFLNPGTVDDPHPQATPGLKMETVFTFVTAYSARYGMVPFGFGGGIFKTDGTLEKLGSDARYINDRMYTRYSPRTKEISDTPVVAIAMATSFGDPKGTTISATRVKGIISRTAPGAANALPWDKASAAPSLGNFTNSANFVRFAADGAAYNYTFADNKLSVPLSKVEESTAKPQLVLMKVDAKNGAAGDLSWYVYINPAKLTDPSTNKVVLNAAAAPAIFKNGAPIAFTAYGLKFNSDAASFANMMSPKMGDVEQVSNQVSSFSVYRQSMTKK